ncbi:MAG: hypothetical protein JJ895_14405 [Balneolaceae bacterium]|nr:hypothetical protein [Balneolaceae bacterium]
MEPSDFSPQLFEVEDGSLSFQRTPWDAKVLNKPALAILKIDTASKNYESLLASFLASTTITGDEFYSARIPADNHQLKLALQNIGFQIVEHTLDVTSSSFDTNLAEELLQRIPVTTTPNVSDQLDAVKSIASESFNFGRFHEDPKITLEQASLRNRNWIDNLISQGADFNILLKKEKAIGFMAWKVKEQDKAQLLFGGVKSNFQHLSYSFWADTLLKLSTNASINTTISSSNTPVLNLYNYFGFHFTNPQFGLHFHR